MARQQYVNGELVTMSAAEEAAFNESLQQPVTMDAIMVERDRRIDAGFQFLGKVIQSRPEDRENIIGASVLAGQAVTLGDVQPGDLRWHGGDSDFAWITADNSLLNLDALTTIELGKVAAAQKSGLIFAAKAIKERVDAGEDVGDITSDSLWA